MLETLLILAVAYSQIQRLLRTRGVERQQLKWFAYAIVMAALVAPFSTATGKLGQVLLVPAGLFIPISVGIAILRYRLFDIDLIINRTLVYGPLLGILAGVFAASSTVSQLLCAGIAGGKSDAATVLTTLIVVAVFTPMKERLEKIIERRFKHAPDTPWALKTYRERVRSVIQILDPQQSTRQLLDIAAQALSAKSGAVYFEEPGQTRLVHTFGEWNGAVKVSVALESGGARLGCILLGQRRDGTDYTPAERAVLQETANDLAAAIQIVAPGAKD